MTRRFLALATGLGLLASPLALTPGQVSAPEPVDGAFLVIQLHRRTEPDPTDPATRRRLTRELLAPIEARESAARIRWVTPATL